MGRVVRFDCFEVDLAARRLSRHRRRVRLSVQPFEVLALLIERAGQVVTREELRHRLWPDAVFVEFDNNLNTAVARLRRALSDSAARPRFIETLPKGGYRFIGSLDDSRTGSLAPTVPSRRRILVLPFLNLTGDASLDYMSDGLTEEVITDLAALASDGLAVIARTTAMRYKGRATDVGAIGRALNVEYVVEGAVRGAGTRLAVNAQLIRVEDQTHVWARQDRAPRAEVFRSARGTARAIAGALGAAGGRVGAHARPVTGRRGTSNPAAYSEYLQGRYCLEHLKGFFEGCAEGRAHFERAVACDPDFAAAHESLAELHSFLGYMGAVAPHEALGDGLLHAVRALEIDNRRAETRAVLAQYYKQLDYRWRDTERELTQALEASGSSPLVRMLYAVGWLMPQGHVDRAAAELERALEWDPLSYALRAWLAIMHALARDFDRAADEARLLIELEPDGAVGHWALGFGLRGKGLVAESIEAHRRAAVLSGGAPMMLGWLGLVLGAAGQSEQAREALRQLEAAASTRYVPPSSFAWVHLGLREIDQAFDWMERAVAARDQLMMPIKSYAFLDPIRPHPRFAGLLRAMKLDA